MYLTPWRIQKKILFKKLEIYAKLILSFCKKFMYFFFLFSSCTSIYYLLKGWSEQSIWLGQEL